ncbi:hypothetical protein GOP47_0017904 [Adiantum capillus-veneris]|uniref:PUB 62/63 C-terminal domain-containing protein n=1 Tax=Adiantum capillus-veneris TaxID=13818 RepID=A0A9D4ZC89_ADICA|nr:hypothetical protein GOP47_0017904 [Adiantum capillus-veneris]
MEASFNALSARLMHQEHFSRLYHGGPPGVPSRGDPVRSFRPETVGSVDGQGYGTLDRDHFLAGSVREFNSGNSQVLTSTNKSEGLVDEGQRFANGSSHISNAINTSPRVLDWAGSEQPVEMGSEAEYRELEDGDGGSSGQSQSDGSDEEDDDDGDIDGEGEDIESHQEVAGLVDHRLSGQRNCEALGPMQNKGAERFIITCFCIICCASEDTIEKETSLKDGYDKEKGNYSNEQSRNAHSSPVPEAVPIRSATAQCYSSLVQATSVNSQKDQESQIVTFSQRKHHETMEMPLRSALTDPLTGALMDDATILLCGHSFGSESLQRVLENNACISCGAAARREDMAPNHALQLVVQAYRREEQRWKENASRAAKRRRERMEQDRQNIGELAPIDFSRHKGVQFPYKVNDKVLIKGNKRTPERFVGRNAIITTQCLNGWYVVRTLDNGESVKLQYRSLTKTEEQESQPNVAAPNWL